MLLFRRRTKRPEWYTKQSAQQMARIRSHNYRHLRRIGLNARIKAVPTAKNWNPVRTNSADDIKLQEPEGATSLGTLGEDRVSFGIVFGRKPSPPSGPTPRLPDGKSDLSGIWSAFNPDKPAEIVPLPSAKAGSQIIPAPADISNVLQ